MGENKIPNHVHNLRTSSLKYEVGRLPHPPLGSLGRGQTLLNHIISLESDYCHDTRATRSTPTENIKNVHFSVGHYLHGIPSPSVVRNDYL
jgi:hypothetical protein